MVLGLEDFERHVGRRITGFEGFHRGNEIGERNVEGDEKEWSVANT